MNEPGIRRCQWCDKPLPAGSRSHRRTCTRRCRQALSRWERERADIEHTTG